VQRAIGEGMTGRGYSEAFLKTFRYLRFE